MNEKEKKNEKPVLMKMACCGRVQAWRSEEAGQPVAGEETWCVWCQKLAKIEKVF